MENMNVLKEMDTFNEKEKNKTVDALVDSIDNGEHNDVDIILEDGVIRASKLILCSRLEYFEKAFDKKSQFQEQKENTVKFPCKKVIMRKILEHLYGGRLDFTGLSYVEIMELEEMLRFLLLQDAQKELQKFLVSQIHCNKIPVPECLDAVEVAMSFNLSKSKAYLTFYFVLRLDILVTDHLEVVQNMSEEIFLSVISCIEHFGKKRVGYSKNSWQYQRVGYIKELDKLKFVNHWIAFNKSRSQSEESESYFFKMIHNGYFDLTKFTVNQLLGEVRNSKLFSDEEIFAAVNYLHNLVADENRLLKQKAS